MSVHSSFLTLQYPSLYMYISVDLFLRVHNKKIIEQKMAYINWKVIKFLRLKI
jgi:hypothetical protein